jgi:hypothetical protein
VGEDRHSSNPTNSKTSSSSSQALPAINTSRDAVNQTKNALPDSTLSETPWKSGPPSPADSEVTTPPLSLTSSSTPPSLLSPKSGSSKRPIELEDDENPARLHEKKARSR